MTEGEIGVPIAIDTKMDLTGAENCKIYAKHPMGTSIFPAQVENETELVYVTQAVGDLPDGSGGEWWWVQGEFDLGGAVGVRTPARKFFVSKRI